MPTDPIIDAAVARALERLHTEKCTCGLIPDLAETLKVDRAHCCRPCSRAILTDLRREVLEAASHENPRPPEPDTGWAKIDGPWQAGFLTGVGEMQKCLRALAEEKSP